MDKKLVTVIGGSGFLGRHISRRFAKAGWRVRVAVRRPNEALFVRSYGDIGQVEPVQINIRDEDSIARAIVDSDVVVNTVGILSPEAKQNFDEIHHIAPERIARVANEQGIKAFAHVSALGAADGAASHYLQSKFDGEKAVAKAYKKALIVRPSLMFGGENDFFNRFATMTKFLPFLGVIKADTRFQPVFVDDVAEFIIDSMIKGRSGVYDLGGEQIFTMREIMAYVSDETRRNRPLIAMPNFMASIMATLLDAAQFITIGLFRNNVLTRDQLRSLDVHNVIEGKDGLAAAGINPKRVRAVMSRFMTSFRPRGEFEELVKPK